jgi:heme/copper-type cytochrome/quinol oxidase subunit 2
VAIKERSDDNKRATPHTRRGFRALMWMLVVIVAVIVMVLAMWGHLAQNGTSTVNPTKTPPPVRQ